MSEQRVAATRTKISQRGSAEQPSTADAQGQPSGGKPRKRMVAVALVVTLILGGGGGYWFVLGPGADGQTAEASDVEPEPELGVVQSVESVSINLADGRYLRLGVALQLSADVEEEVNPSKAIDTAIALFSGRSVDEVSSAEGRVALKLSLAEQLREAYHDEIIDVYLTEYVTQ